MQRVYFIGIGGIGMSAIARLFRHEGREVSGYDRTATPLTCELEGEGITITYSDMVSDIPTPFTNKESTLIIYTPAIPKNHPQLNYFIDNGFRVIKRSEALGEITRERYVMSVAQKHGKSSTYTMLEHFNKCGSNSGGGSAFLGAISKNYNSNLVLGSGDRVVVEADEFDRSFLQLRPNVALITSVDADHLDIYGTHSSLLDSFTLFTSQVVAGGAVIYRKGIELNIENRDIKVYSYSLEDSTADFYTRNLGTDSSDMLYCFDIVCPDRVIEGCKLGVHGKVNVENCVGAVAMMWVAGLSEEGLKEGISSFRGLKRRFDIRYSSDKVVYIDDYAHHPTELSATIGSIRELFPNRKITALFQPHLYSRTRDFADDFSTELSKVDRVILLPIYPAREEPISGVSSDMLLDGIAVTDKCLVAKEDILELLARDKSLDILVTFGAGDIDTLCAPIDRLLEERSCRYE